MRRDVPVLGFGCPSLCNPQNSGRDREPAGAISEKELGPESTRIDSKLGPESTVNWDPNRGLSGTISVRYNQFGDPLRRADDRVVSTASISKPANAERTSGGSLMLSKKRPLSPASCWAIRPNCVRSNRGAPASDAWFGVGRMRDFGDAIDDPFGKVALAADIGRDRPCRTHRREGFGCIFRPRPVPFHSLFVPASRSREAGRPR